MNERVATVAPGSSNVHRALLIDDEPPARNVMRALLGAHPGIGVVGEAGTLGAAREQLARSDYTLVFLDVQLRGGTGFDLVPFVRPGASIIFVTAHDEHALRAFEVNALDYLLKPIKPERLAATIRRCEVPRRPADAPGELPSERLRSGDTVYVRTYDGARFLPLATISALQSCENYSELTLVTGDRLLVRYTLRSWEDSLPRPPFARVHRQALVNLTCLARIEDDGGDGPLLHVTGLRTPLRVSRREWSELRALLPTESGRPFRIG
jgi:two-component system, LytTR family, response regulator